MKFLNSTGIEESLLTILSMQPGKMHRSNVGKRYPPINLDEFILNFPQILNTTEIIKFMLSAIGNFLQNVHWVAIIFRYLQ